MVTRNFKFRLYPNQSQWKRLDNTLGVCKWVYNKMVEHVKNGFVSRNELNYFLTELKEQEPWLYSYHSKMLQMISTQIDSAQKSLIQLRRNGYKTKGLKFVKYSEYRSFTYNQTGFKIQNGFLYLSKIGQIKIVQHRKISEDSKIKQVIITKSKSGKWNACVTCEIDIILPEMNPRKSVGIDVGIRNFTYDSDGLVTTNPLYLQKMLKPLARAHRKISRRKKGSKNRRKAVKFYQLIHERIKNRRKDTMHKLSTYYATKYDIVFIERLQKVNMLKNHRLSRGILDSGWQIFSRMLSYKTNLVEVSARNTTTNCCRCGTNIPKSLAVRIHKCKVCNLVIDRDYNASINILKRGLNQFYTTAGTVESNACRDQILIIEAGKGYLLSDRSSLKDSKKV